MASCINLQGSISGQQILPLAFDKSIGTLFNSLRNGAILDVFILKLENVIMKDFLQGVLCYTM